MTTTLITGANRSLGYETARRLIGDGHDVWMAARDPEPGKKAAAELGGRFVALDVTDDDSVAAAAAAVAAAGGLDVLVNNAGIVGARKPIAEMTADDVRAVYETNVFGVVRVTQAFLPLLEQSPHAVLVNVSSGMGSLARTSDPQRVESSFAGLAYQSSKSAVNMLTSQYAKAYPKIRVKAVDPGYTATDFNKHKGTQTVQEGAEAIVRAARFGAGDQTGTFVDRAGTVPW